jgi:cytochrome P450
MCIPGSDGHGNAPPSRATARLHDTMYTVFNGVVDGIADAGRCDVVGDIALAYPEPIICALLGAPSEDWARFLLWAADIFKAFRLQPSACRRAGRRDGCVVRTRRLRRRRGGPVAGTG